MTRGELYAVMRKAACAGRSGSRLSMLKRAYYAHEALPRGFSYTAALYPINPTLARMVNLGMPKAVRRSEHEAAGRALRASGVSTGAMPMAASPRARRLELRGMRVPASTNAVGSASR